MKIHAKHIKIAPLFGWRNFQRKERLTAEGKSFPRGCLLLTRTTTTKSKVLCATITLIGRIQGYEFRNPIAVLVGSATSIYLSKALGNILIIVYAFSAKDHGKDDISVISSTPCCKLYLWQPRHFIHKDKFLLQRQLPIKHRSYIISASV